MPSHKAIDLGGPSAGPGRGLRSATQVPTSSLSGREAAGQSSSAFKLRLHVEAHWLEKWPVLNHPFPMKPRVCGAGLCSDWPVARCIQFPCPLWQSDFR